MLNGTMKQEDAAPNHGGFGAIEAPSGFAIAWRWEIEHRLGSAPVSYGVDGWCIHEFPSIVFFFSLKRRLGHDKISQDLSTG